MNLTKYDRLPRSFYRGTQSAFEIGQSARIGIDYAEEYRNVQWRFYEKDSEFVSK